MEGSTSTPQPQVPLEASRGLAASYTIQKQKLIKDSNLVKLRIICLNTRLGADAAENFSEKLSAILNRHSHN